jgi:hypothetical protein
MALAAFLCNHLFLAQLINKNPNGDDDLKPSPIIMMRPYTSMTSTLRLLAHADR